MRLRADCFQKHAKAEAGVLLPAVIFLLVILAAIGAYAINLTSVQQTTSAQDTEGSRAYHAARAGIELGIYQVLTPGSTALVACPAPQTLTIDQYSVSLSCTAYGQYKEQGTDHTIAVYLIIASATKGTVNTPQRVARQIEVTVSKCLGTDATPSYTCS